VGKPERRGRLLLISALAQALLTLLGAAGESLGYDTQLKTNTAKKRTHSLFTQGAYYFMAMPRMSDARLLPSSSASPNSYASTPYFAMGSGSYEGSPQGLAAAREDARLPVELALGLGAEDLHGNDAADYDGQGVAQLLAFLGHHPQ
jgi:hypothetical protein